MIAFLSLALVQEPSDPQPSNGGVEIEEEQGATNRENPNSNPIKPPQTIPPESQFPNDPAAQRNHTEEEREAASPKQEPPDKGIGWIPTVLLVAGSFALCIVAYLQYRLLKTIFLTTHGPRLRVRQVHIPRIQEVRNDGTSLISLEEIFQQSQNGMRGQFEVSNAGSTRACSIEGCGSFFIDGTVGAETPIKFTKLEIPQEINAGESHKVIVPPTKEVSPTDFDRMRTRELDTYLAGYIRFKDSSGNDRKIAFLRKFDRDLNRFTPVDNPDYEYED